MLSYLDHGIRCDRHVGEVFPPRCRDCNAAAREDDAATLAARYARTLPGAECDLHAGYVLDRHPDGQMTCARCERDADDAL
jgi:hypothetical protein